MIKELLTDELLKVQKELNDVNDNIIDRQDKIIETLKEQNQLLKEIIEEHLLGGKKIEEVI